MLPSRNNVINWWIQECSYLNAKASRMWVPDSSLDRIDDKKMASIGTPKLTSLIEISQKRHQLEFQTTRFRYGTVRKDWIHLKENKKEKKKNIVIKQSSLPQIQLKRIEPNVYFLYEAWFFHFFHWKLLGGNFGVRKPPFWNKKHCNVFCFSFGEIRFSVRVRFFASVSKKLTSAFFAENRRKNGFY